MPRKKLSLGTEGRGRGQWNSIRSALDVNPFRESRTATILGLRLGYQMRRLGHGLTANHTVQPGGQDIRGIRAVAVVFMRIVAR